jgi:two-component system, sensor histidine kinase PdtaS
MEAFVTKLLALRLSLPVRYGLATLLIGAVTGIRLLLADFLEGYPYLLYFPVVIICGLVLEHGTSLYATFLCGFLAVFLFVEPHHQLGLGTTGDTVALMLFLVTAFAMSSIIEVMRLGAGRLKTSRDEAYKILEERDLLLRELVHRVKNDFQAASHLLRIQSIQVTHPGTKEALRAAADRISIMGRVHTRLTHQNQREKVNLEAFLRELAADLQVALIGSRLISLDLDVEAILVSQKQAVYIGLIVNELLTNALKYAFPDDRLGRVVVTLQREDDHVLLQVADNGVGTLPEVAEMTGLGTGLVRTLVQLLDGTLEVESEHGMSYIACIRVDQEPQ